MMGVGFHYIDESWALTCGSEMDATLIAIWCLPFNPISRKLLFAVPVFLCRGTGFLLNSGNGGCLGG